LYFFQKFDKIFTGQGAPPVSLTPVANGKINTFPWYTFFDSYRVKHRPQLSSRFFPSALFWKTTVFFFLVEDLPDQINVGLAGLPGVCHQLLRVVDGGDTVHLSVQNPNWTSAQTKLLNENIIYQKTTCCMYSDRQLLIPTKVYQNSVKI
jgi:hypothetical protein